MNLAQNLYKKYEGEKLAHLYLIEPQFQDDSQFTFKFIEEFFERISGQQPQNHPDILFIREAEKKHYLKEQIIPIYNFIKHPALTLKNKFVVFEHVHKISELMVNKLLKDFEEPPIELTIFLLNPRKVKLIPTLESRAIRLRLPMEAELNAQINPSIEVKNFEKFVKDSVSTMPELQDYLKRLSSHLTLTDNNFESMQQFKVMMESIQQDIDINNPLQHMQFKLFSFIQKHLRN